MKGSVRVGGAAVIGILVILGAFYVRANQQQTAAGAIVVTQAPVREYINTTDSDGDGVKDWEEDLKANVFEAIKAPAVAKSSSTKSYTPPKTLTGKFSEAFLADYMQGKVSGADFSDPAAFADRALKAVEQNTTSRTYSPADITFIPSSGESIREYGNQIMRTIMNLPAKDTDALQLLSDAINSNNPSKLSELAYNEDVYRQITERIISIEVPDYLIEEHLKLINACEALRTDLHAMQLTFDDTLYSIARVKRYGEDNEALLGALSAIILKLTDAGVYYAKEEPGSLFYTIRP